MADGLTCDRCAKTLLVDERVRYVAEVKVYAAYDPLELTAEDLAKDHRAEIERLCKMIEGRDPEELMDEVARVFKLDLCPGCQKRLLREMRAGPEPGPAGPGGGAAGAAGAEERPAPPAVLDSERVVLRKHSPEDAERMFAAVDRDRARLGRFLPWVDATRSVEDERAYIRSSLERWERGELFDYSLFAKAGGGYMGNAGVHSVAWEHRRCEIGYWILDEFEGRGFMSEAVRLLESACFDAGFERIEIRCSSSNARSASVARRLGYRHEGTLRAERIEQGEPRDTLIFAKLRSERG